MADRNYVAQLVLEYKGQQAVRAARADLRGVTDQAAAAEKRVEQLLASLREKYQIDLEVDIDPESIIKEINRIKRQIESSPMRSITAGEGFVDYREAAQDAKALGAAVAQLQQANNKAASSAERLATAYESAAPALSRQEKTILSLANRIDALTAGAVQLGKIDLANFEEAFAEIERARAALADMEAGGVVDESRIENALATLRQLNNVVADGAQEVAVATAAVGEEEQAFNQVSAAAQRTGVSIEASQRQAQQAVAKTTLASQSAIRIIQDMPYGLMGITNNIQQFSEEIGRLAGEIDPVTKEARGMGNAFRAAFAGMFMGPMAIPLLITLVTTLALSWDKLTGFIDNARVALGLMTIEQMNFNAEVEKDSISDLQSAIAELSDVQLAQLHERWIEQQTRLEGVLEQNQRYQEEAIKSAEIVSFLGFGISALSEETAAYTDALRVNNRSLRENIGWLEEARKIATQERQLRETRKLIEGLTGLDLDPERVRKTKNKLRDISAEIEKLRAETLAGHTIAERWWTTQIEHADRLIDLQRQVREGRVSAGQAAELREVLELLRESQAEDLFREADLAIVQGFSDLSASIQTEEQALLNARLAAYTRFGELRANMEVQAGERAMRARHDAEMQAMQLEVQAFADRREQILRSREQLDAELARATDEAERKRIESAIRASEREREAIETQNEALNRRIAALVAQQEADRVEHAQRMIEIARQQRQAELEIQEAITEAELDAIQARSDAAIAAREMAISGIAATLARIGIYAQSIQEAAELEEMRVRAAYEADVAMLAQEKARLAEERRLNDEQLEYLRDRRQQIMQEIVQVGMMGGDTSMLEGELAAVNNQIALHEAEGRRIIAVEEATGEKRKALRVQLNNDLEAIEREAARRRFDLIVSSTQQVASGVASAYESLYNTWRTMRERELREAGVSEEERTRILREEGAKRFRIMKALRIAEAIANTIAAGVQAYKTGVEIAGPLGLVVGAAMMATALATGYAQVRALQALQPDSGGQRPQFFGRQYTALNRGLTQDRIADFEILRTSRGRSGVGGGPDTDRFEKAVERFEQAAANLRLNESYGDVYERGLAQYERTHR